MSGIFGYIKTTTESQLDKMIKVMDRHKKTKLVYNFENSDLGIAQVSLDLYDKNRISDEDYELIIEGTCYNLNELNEIHNTGFEYFSEIILWAYKNSQLKQLLNKVDGYFVFSLYDKKNNKLLLANDRNGLMPMYIYNKDNHFVFSNELKAILTLDYVDKTVDKIAFEMFMKFEHLLGGITWFENIKSVNPAMLMEFDMGTRTLNQEHYWTFAQVEKSDLTFEQAVDKAYELFNKAVKKQFNMKLNPTLPLSGGFDSRLVLASALKLYPDLKPYVYTFGFENCQDYVTAEKVCKIAKLEHHKYDLDKTDWLAFRKKLVYDNDCMVSLMHFHGLEFSELLPEEYNLSMSGFSGDSIYGDHYLPQNKEWYNKKFDKVMAKYYYDVFYENSNYDDEYFDINNSAVLRLWNRVRNFTNQVLVLFENNMAVIRPFFDNDVIEFFASIPNEYLENDKLYNHMVLKYYPEYFKNINRNSKKPICIKKDLDYRIRKLKYSLEKFAQKWGIIKLSKGYTNYASWIQEEPVASEIRNLLFNDSAVYKKYLNIDTEELFKDVNNKKVKTILTLCSIELYFKQINNKLERSVIVEGG